MTPILRAALLLSVVAATLAQLPKAFPQRTRGAIHSSAREIDRSQPPGERLAVISNDDYNGLYFNYYIYPRPTRLYRNLDDYRLDEKHPRTIVYATERARVMPYAAIRAEQMNGFIATPSYAPAGTHFIVPLAASFDGYPPASYTTEGWLKGRANATLTLRPRGLVKTLTINGAASFKDLVYENFGVLESGWVEVASDAPLQASFALVNRGTKSATPIALLRDVPRRPLRIASGEKLWLVNTTADPASATACGAQITLPPYAIESRAATFPCDVTGAYAFGSQKLPDGGTRFTWPDWR